MQLAIQLLLITLVVEHIGWIGSEQIAGFVRHSVQLPLRLAIDPTAGEPAAILQLTDPGS